MSDQTNASKAMKKDVLKTATLMVQKGVKGPVTPVHMISAQNDFMARLAVISPDCALKELWFLTKNRENNEKNAASEWDACRSASSANERKGKNLYRWRGWGWSGGSCAGPRQG